MAPPPPDLAVHEVEVPTRPLHRLEPVVGPDRYRALRAAGRTHRAALTGTTVWNVSSTAAGGGVAEMLHLLVGYVRDLGVDARWLVVTGDPGFFAVTKRLHNRLHGVPGDDGGLDAAARRHYDDVLRANLPSLLDRVRPGDVVLLHDPQTAGLAGPLVGHGARVVWRCHVGREGTNAWTDEAWAFLRPLVEPCHAVVFSLAAYVPAWVDPGRVHVIPPSIDPSSPKNQDLGRTDVHRVLVHLGVLDDGPAGTLPFTRTDGSPGTVTGRAEVVAEPGAGLGPGDPLVVQVSRWDRLKDMPGVMAGFASAAGRSSAHLALVGPSVAGVTDDPEGAEVLAGCLDAWAALPPDVRRRVRLVTLPMDDLDENAAMVNAVQRHATVVVQKSLREGFGLTVAEAMWKGRAVVASRVGGITGQVVPGTGLLLDDPADLDAFGAVLADLLAEPAAITRLGRAAHRHVRDEFVGDLHLLRYAALVDDLLGDAP